jgi:WD40 repeat protein
MTKAIATLFLVTFIGLGNVQQAPAEDLKVCAVLRHDDSFDGSVRSVAFSPDGSMLASACNLSAERRPEVTRRGGQGGEVKAYVVIWNVAKKEKVKTIECPGSAQFVAFSPDGNLVAAAQHDKDMRPQVRILETATWRDRHLILFKKDEDSSRSVSAMAFAPDGRSLVVATFGYPRGAALEIIDPVTGRTRNTLKVGGVDEGNANSLSFSAGGKLLASITDRTVHVWDMASGKVRNSFAVGRGNRAAMAPDGTTIAVATIGSRKYPGVVGLTLRDAKTGEVLTDFEGSSRGTGIAVLFTPDGKRLIYGRAPGVIVVYDTTTGRRLSAADGPSLDSLAIARSGNLIASGNPSATVWLWDIGSGK